jgi:nucleobase:cation symporter-1, NCS1 family
MNIDGEPAHTYAESVLPSRESRHRDFSYLFQTPKNTVLKAVNPAAMIAFAGGILMTWMCMYGSFPILQGPIATAAGGIDFSWLAGTITAAGLYFVLGLRRFRDRIDAGVPLGLKADIDDEEAARRQETVVALAGAEPEGSTPEGQQPTLHAVVDATTEATDDQPDPDRAAVPLP